ncbi:hypothetical protein RI129_013185 [Pyrocoelia pectoralis]|uniref:Protein amnionless n=1 Tax=Pyrocoelia pectoralis TaxID=417401 RepID=A0AAN7UVS5_9COLE
MWKFNNDVSNPIHWENGSESKDCIGFIFPDILGSVGSISQLIAAEVTLPSMGELEIQNGGFIEISNGKKCARVKEIVPKHWLDPKNWESSDNVAVPDVERVPCTYDDVSFPSAVAVYYPELPVSVNSIEIRGVKLSNTQWQNFLQSDYGIEQFQMLTDSRITVAQKTCALKSGCRCHLKEEIMELVCEHVPKNESPLCFHPIRPVGFCTDICGGIILADVGPAFSLEVFKQRLPKNEYVDIYASKIASRGGQKVQIVFVEKTTYTERSQKEASKFHATLMQDLERYKLKGALLEISGISLPQGTVGAAVLQIVFGTLIGILAIFFTLYIIYVGPLKDYDFRSRLPIVELLFGKRKFSKFENEGVSMAASMVSLEKSFDNPMYGAIEPSTSNEAFTLMEERSQGKKDDLDVIEDVHDTDEDCDA